MARRRREISFPLVFVLSLCFVFVFVFSSGFFTTFNLCKEYERKLTAFDGGVSVRFKRWPPFDVSAAESLLSPRLDPISGSTGRSLLPSQCLPPHTSYLHGVSPSHNLRRLSVGRRSRRASLVTNLGQDFGLRLQRMSRLSVLSGLRLQRMSRDDVVDQIWGLYRSGKQTKPDLALRLPSRYKSTKNHSATNPSPVSHLKDRPLPPPSTWTPAPPSPARRSMPSTMTPANPPCLTLPSTRTPILDPPTHNRRSWTTTTSRTSTRKLGFHLVGLFINFGPSLKLWPNTKNSGVKSETTRPSFRA